MKTNQDLRPLASIKMNRKNPHTAFILSILFGSYGMLYSTINGAIVMFFIHAAILLSTSGLGLLLSWPLGAIWAANAAKHPD